MQITQINTNNHRVNSTTFKAGKIKVLNPSVWTDGELKAFIQNDEFKKLATKLKKKDLDLFVLMEKAKDKTENRELCLYSGKADKPENFIQKIIGAIWCCTPEKRSLIDNIVLFPQKTETLFERENKTHSIEKQKIAKELEKKNIVISDLGYWHLSELKALNANKKIKQLPKRSDLENKKLHFVRDYSDFLNGNYIEVYKECSNIGTIFPRNYTYNNSSSITDAIATFDDFIYCTADKAKEKALNEIEKFNQNQDTSNKSAKDFIKSLFSQKS